MSAPKTKNQEMLDDQFLLACENGDVDLASKLLADGAAVDTRNSLNETALHLAVKSGSAKIVSFLVNDLGIGTEPKDSYGRTPLHWAAQQGNMPIVEVLLMARADVEAKDEAGMEAKVYAEMSGHRDLVRLFSIVRASRK